LGKKNEKIGLVDSFKDIEGDKLFDENLDE
jgi:hypothetical protein